MKKWIIPIIGTIICIILVMAIISSELHCGKYHYEKLYRGFPPAEIKNKVCDG